MVKKKPKMNTKKKIEYKKAFDKKFKLDFSLLKVSHKKTI